MIEALHEPGAVEGPSDDSGGGQAAEFFDCHAIGIGHINNGLSIWSVHMMHRSLELCGRRDCLLKNFMPF